MVATLAFPSALPGMPPAPGTPITPHEETPPQDRVPAQAQPAEMMAGALRLGAPVEGRDGRLGTVAGTRAAEAGSDLAYLLVRQSRVWGLWYQTRAVPLSWMREPQPGFSGVTLDASRAEVAGSPLVRPDRRVRADVAEALRAGMDSVLKTKIHITVQNGVVKLTGHARHNQDTLTAVGTAQGVRGVLGVQCTVVDDEALTAGIVQALDAHPGARAARLAVRVRFGNVALVGRVPDQATRHDAIALARAVPGVLRVTDATTGGPLSSEAI